VYVFIKRKERDVKRNMETEVMLTSGFSKYLPPGSENFSCRLELEEGVTISQVLEKLKIPRFGQMTIFVNGAPSKLNHQLQPGDKLKISPPLPGG
jgi:sulfur carrier protein ThiS